MCVVNRFSPCGKEKRMTHHSLSACIFLLDMGHGQNTLRIQSTWCLVTVWSIWNWKLCASSMAYTSTISGMTILKKMPLTSIDHATFLCHLAPGCQNSQLFGRNSLPISNVNPGFHKPPSLSVYCWGYKKTQWRFITLLGYILPLNGYHGTDEIPEISPIRSEPGFNIQNLRGDLVLCPNVGWGTPQVSKHASLVGYPLVN